MNFFQLITGKILAVMSGNISPEHLLMILGGLAFLGLVFLASIAMRFVPVTIKALR